MASKLNIESRFLPLGSLCQAFHSAQTRLVDNGPLNDSPYPGGGVHDLRMDGGLPPGF